MAVLQEMQDAIDHVRTAVASSVVGIGDRWARGSGMVVAPGKVLTNAHNLRGDEATVTFDDGRSATGSRAGVDMDGDLAVLSVDTAEAPVVAWSTDGSVAIGAPVFGLSNPGGRGLRVSLGFVSGIERRFRGPRGRRIAGAIEHTAPLLPGSSGGPVVDAEGRVLGINTHRLGEGFYLAMAADEELRARIDGLGRGESPSRPRLGVGIVPKHMARRLRRAVGLPDADGLLIRFVEDGSPAAAAGLQRGDLIVAARGSAVADADDLQRELEAVGPGATVELQLLRGTEERTVSLELASG